MQVKELYSTLILYKATLSVNYSLVTVLHTINRLLKLKSFNLLLSILYYRL
jgi:hypothetical protein